MNTKRIVAGGLLAGSIIVIGEAIRNVVFGDSTPASAGSMPLAVLVLRGASLGIFCVLLYAAVRPRLGASAKSALTVGILAFLVGTLFPPFGLTMQTFSPARLLLVTIIWNDIQIPLATVAGAWLYREALSEPGEARRWSGEPQAAR